MPDYFNENMNIISGLEPKPNLSAAAMQTKFDEAGNKIKDFINSTLATDVAGLKAGTALADGAVKTNKLDGGAVTNAKLGDGSVTSDKLDKLTKIVLEGSEIYGTQTDMNNVSNPVVGQIFFKKVT